MRAAPGRSPAKMPTCGSSIAFSNSVGLGSEVNTTSFSCAAAKALSARIAPCAHRASVASLQARQSQSASCGCRACWETMDDKCSAGMRRPANCMSDRGQALTDLPNVLSCKWWMVWSIAGYRQQGRILVASWPSPNMVQSSGPRMAAAGGEGCLFNKVDRRHSDPGQPQIVAVGPRTAGVTGHACNLQRRC